MIHYPKYAPKNIRCPECNGQLEIWAFRFDKDNYEPVLVCDHVCGTFFSLEECHVTEQELRQ